MALFVLLIVGIIIIMIKSNSRPRTRNSQSRSSALNDSGIGIKVSTNRFDATNKEQINKLSAKWIPPNQKVRICGLNIEGGMFYTGSSLPSVREYGYESKDACLINPTLKVTQSEPWLGGDELGYWPHYHNLSPKCRGAYIKWLATGRSEPETNIGYVFLFFYGLERRLLVDGQNGWVLPEERDAIVSEIQRLITIYGCNRSFKGYASNLLAIEWVLYRSTQRVPDYIDFDDRYCEQPFQVILARYVAAGKPIPAKVALQWIKMRPEQNLRTPARRCPKEFKILFIKRYEAKYGDGFIIKPNKTPLQIEYHAASPSIPRDIKLKIADLPNPYILSGPINKIAALTESCVNDLEAYSRFLGRKGNVPNSPAAISLLPKDLFAEIPGICKLKSKLNEFCLKENGYIQTRYLYHLLGEVPAQINKKEAEILCCFMDSLEYGIAPDVRYHGVKPSLDGLITVFPDGHGIDFKPSKEFLRMGTILRMGAIVSQIDNDFSVEEQLLLNELISANSNLTQTEKSSLKAYLNWMLKTPQNISGLKQRFADITMVEKEAISKILISVANADGKVMPSEIKQLESLYTTLGLDKSTVSNDLHLTAMESEPVTMELRDNVVSYSIPQPSPDSSKPVALQLNEQLIRIREEETRQVKGVLEKIFTEQLDECNHEECVSEAGTVPNPIDGLDELHRTLFYKLESQQTWERTVFYSMCTDLGLMADGAMEVINEWAYDLVNAPLIEDGDLIYIDTELAKEIING